MYLYRTITSQFVLLFDGNMNHMFMHKCMYYTISFTFMYYWHSSTKILIYRSVFVIKHLYKYALPFPRMHSNVDSFDSCVIFLVSSRWKNRLHTVSSYTLIYVASHAKTSHESLWSDHTNRGQSSTLTLLIVYQVTFLLNVHCIQIISKAFDSKLSR